MKRIGFFCSVILLLLIASLARAGGEEWVRVKWVADGDTVILNDGRHVRYIGIDAPETEHPHQRAEPMAEWARAVNCQLVEGWRLRLVLERDGKDRYGRTLAHVYRGDGLWINAALLKKGCANVLYQWPNTGKAHELLGFQHDAMEKGLGIWQRINRHERPDRPYRGNRRSMRFHQNDCAMGKTMALENQIWIKNKWEAFWNGYSPARECVAFP